METAVHLLNTQQKMNQNYMKIDPVQNRSSSLKSSEAKRAQNVLENNKNLRDARAKFAEVGKKDEEEERRKGEGEDRGAKKEDGKKKEGLEDGVKRREEEGRKREEAVKKKAKGGNALAQNFLETEESNKRRNTHKAKKIRKLKKMLKYNDTSAAILGIVGLILAVIEYEIFYDNTGKNRYSSTEASTFYRSLVTISTAVVLFLLVIHSFVAFKLAIEKGTNDSEVGYFSSRNFKQLILELVVIGIHCPPTYDKTFQVTELDHNIRYSIPGCMMCWMLLRFYLVFRLFAQYSKWTNELAEECCEPEGCEANTIFAMKAVLKEKPFLTILVLMTLSTVIFGLAVRHFEQPYYENMNPKSSDFQDYSYIWNAMWLIMITMMTVGYGDYFPRTHMGRFVCILACFWGVFLVSMMVVTLTVVSSFDSKQRRAYDILFRLNIKEELKKKGAYVLTMVIRIRALYCRFSKGKLSKENYQKERIKINSDLEIKLQFFRDLRGQIRDYEITSEEALRQLTEKIDRDLDEVKEMLVSLIQIEKQLTEIEQSQNIVIVALNECLQYTGNVEEFLARNETKGETITARRVSGGEGKKVDVLKFDE